MKKTLTLMLILFSMSIFAKDKSILIQRLTKLNDLYAKFEQTVTAQNGKVLQQGKGELWLKKPNYFNFTLQEPDETIIISDSKNLWFYTPEIEQVTVMNLVKAVDNKLLLLLTDPQSKSWNDFNITRKDNTFKIEPKDKSQQSFEISILNTGMLSDFAILEQDGQKNFYNLTHQNQDKIATQKFTFIKPKNVTVDDQRDN